MSASFNCVCILTFWVATCPLLALPPRVISAPGPPSFFYLRRFLSPLPLSLSFLSSVPIPAAGYNHLDVVECLLEKEADVNAKDKGGLIPLHNAASYGVRSGYWYHQGWYIASHVNISCGSAERHTKMFSRVYSYSTHLLSKHLHHAKHPSFQCYSLTPPGFSAVILLSRVPHRGTFCGCIIQRQFGAWLDQPLEQGQYVLI